MLYKLFNAIFPPPKTELERALEAIKKQKLVRNHSLTDIDPYTGSFFAVGTVKFLDRSMHYDFMNVFFSKKNSDVMIKHNGEIVYYFNGSEEVEKIRQAIIYIYSKEQVAVKALSKL